MIISKITDGIGNQMFQYAFGLFVALNKNQNLKIDNGWYQNIDECYAKRIFLLDQMNIEPSYATEREIIKIREPKYPIIINSVYLRWQYSLPSYRRHYYKEVNPFTYDFNTGQLPNNCYLEGFFQSFKYLDINRNILLNNFFPKHKSTRFNTLSEKINNEPNSVAIHFRLGDYKIPGRLHYCLNQEYYDNAIILIRQNIENPKFYVFSDEIEKVKSFFDLENAVFIENDSDNEIEDMFLMSQCKHNIIANSTYSWWSAWLNKNENKLIVAPLKWFSDESIDTNDLIPSEWTRI